MLRNLRPSLAEIAASLTVIRGIRFGQRLVASMDGPQTLPDSDESNPLRDYFDTHSQGPGIWKWRHYFEIYERHLGKFVGRPSNLLEIGIYSGGSLGMWRHYFGPTARIFGVDIEGACKAYENEFVRVFIGDQADRTFWQKFRDQTPPLDIVIDDGGHRAEQQIVTLEETLPYLRPGGVYLCEDVSPAPNNFTRYVSGLASQLNSTRGLKSSPDNPDRDMTVPATAFQSAIHSVHLYPFVVVIERTQRPTTKFESSRRGTQWQPHR
jgi:hypothetical protein